MSESQLFPEQPVDAGLSEPADEAKPESSPADTSQPTKVEIDGTEYSVEELQELVSGGALRQADYTRKTQEVAEERRRLEELAEELEQRRSDLEGLAARESQREESTDLSELDEISPALRKSLEGISSDISTLKGALQAQQQLAAESQAEDVQVQALEAELASFQSKPFFDAGKILNYMDENGLGPGQVHVAYQAVCGPVIAQNLGEKLATSRGATVETVMGAGQSSVSPGFTTPFEAPGVQKSVSEMSWRDIRDAALRDPNKPAG